MKISERLHMLEIRFGEGTGRMINPALIYAGGKLTLVDAGFPGQFELFKSEIEKAGHKLEDLDYIVVTHQDMDHIGCINEIKAAAPKVKVAAHEIEAPYIEGKKPPYKLSDKIKNYDSLSEEDKKNVDERVENAKKNAVKVDILLKDGDTLDCGAKAILTPGHTSGHMCVYVPEDKALITGDALVVSEGKLSGPNPMHTFDCKEGVKSIAKLLDYDIEAALVYHGGLIDKDVMASLKEIASQ